MRINVTQVNTTSTETHHLYDDATLRDLVEAIGGISFNKVSILVNGAPQDNPTHVLRDGDSVRFMPRNYSSGVLRR